MFFKQKDHRTEEYQCCNHSVILKMLRYADTRCAALMKNWLWWMKNRVIHITFIFHSCHSSKFRGHFNGFSKKFYSQIYLNRKIVISYKPSFIGFVFRFGFPFRCWTFRMFSNGTKWKKWKWCQSPDNHLGYLKLRGKFSKWLKTEAISKSWENVHFVTLLT